MKLWPSLLVLENTLGENDDTLGTMNSPKSEKAIKRDWNLPRDFIVTCDAQLLHNYCTTLTMDQQSAA
jgi:hypothetical protein